MPKFSVAIAVYNKENQIAKTLKSVLAQTCTDFEIIIVNDGSTDKSEAIINSFKDPRINYFSQENQGAGAARNAAINKCSGEYIALLDADDIWQSIYLETIEKLIESHANHQVFATAVTIETAGKIVQSTYSIFDLEPNEIRVVDYFESSYLNTLLTSSSTVLHKSVFEKTGLYDPTIKNGQDTDLWIRIGLNYKIVFINTALVTYKYNEQSLSNRPKNIKNRPNFEAYLSNEKNNAGLKKFLDLNRFSLSIIAKLDNDRDGFKKYFEQINMQNLSKKQRLLLKLSPKSTRFLYSLKNFFERFGIRLSAFK